MQFPFPNVFALGLVGLEERVHRDYRQILCDYDRSAVGAEVCSSLFGDCSSIPLTVCDSYQELEGQAASCESKNKATRARPVPSSLAVPFSLVPTSA